MTPTSNLSISHYLAAAHMLCDGARQLTFEQFSKALGEHINVQGVSPRGIYNRFRDDPAWFISAQIPQNVAESLIAAMVGCLAESAPHKNIS